MIPPELLIIKHQLYFRKRWSSKEISIWFDPDDENRDIYEKSIIVKKNNRRRCILCGFVVFKTPTQTFRFPHNTKKTQCIGRHHQNIKVLYPDLRFDYDASENSIFRLHPTKNDDLDLFDIHSERIDFSKSNKSLRPIFEILKGFQPRGCLAKPITDILHESYPNKVIRKIQKEIEKVINNKSLVNKQHYFSWILVSLHKKSTDGILPTYTIIRCLLLLKNISNQSMKYLNEVLNYPSIINIGHINKYVKHNILYICIFGFKIVRVGVDKFILFIICKGGMTVFPEQRDEQHNKTTFQHFKLNHEYAAFDSFEMITFAGGNVSDSENLVFRLLKETDFFLTTENEKKFVFSGSNGSNEMFSIKTTLTQKDIDKHFGRSIKIDQLCKLYETKIENQKRGHAHVQVYPGILHRVKTFCTAEIKRNKPVMRMFHECSLSELYKFRSFMSILLNHFILLCEVIKTECLNVKYQEAKLDLKEKNQKLEEKEHQLEKKEEEVKELKETIEEKDQKLEEKDQLIEKVISLLSPEQQKLLRQGLQEESPPKKTRKMKLIRRKNAC